jgi:NAD(P)-dependent dehydrogenase (short-subunit alcohol dehydrogenase family)
MTTDNRYVALVTGATGGLGTQMVKRLMDDGYNVVANYRSPGKSEAWKEKMAEQGYAPSMYRADVSDFEEVGPIDILVNNAGITRDGSFRKMSAENWDMVMAVREEVRDQIVQGIPIGRLGGTEEIAHLVSFLASPEVSFITGANYGINGGQHVY